MADGARVVGLVMIADMIVLGITLLLCLWRR